MNKWIEMLKSRRFWASVASVAIVILATAGYDVDESQVGNIVDTIVRIAGVVLSIGVWVIGDAIRPTTHKNNPDLIP